MECRTTARKNRCGSAAGGRSILSAWTLCSLLSACGTESESVAAAASSTTTKPPTSMVAPLRSSPVLLANVLGQTPPTVTKPGPCPFLADLTAIATAKVSDHQPLSRKRVSNSECVWNFNSGFEVSVDIEPLDSASPFSERRYNMDSDPLLVQQTGPGTNAVILQDATWGTARPYAFGFELEGRSVFIKVVGLSTSSPQLRATADEVASKLISAPSIEASRYEEVPAFDQCEVWDSDSLLPVFEYSASDTVTSRSNGVGCTYQFYQQSGAVGRLEASTNFYPMSKASFEKLQERQDTQLLSDYERPVIQRVTADDFGTYYSLIAWFAPEEAAAGVVIMDSDGARETEAKQLFDNLLARLQ